MQHHVPLTTPFKSANHQIASNWHPFTLQGRVWVLSLWQRQPKKATTQEVYLYWHNSSDLIGIGDALILWGMGFNLFWDLSLILVYVLVGILIWYYLARRIF